MGNKGAFINLIGGKLDKPDFKTYEAVVSCDKDISMVAIT